MMASPLDPNIWRPCAGVAVQIPTVNSRVYYFPQGHMDQASSLPQDLSTLLLSRPIIHSTVSAVQFLADPNTDEVFARLSLHPIVDYSTAVSALPPVPAASDNADTITSFVKILTPSDANNGGGFSVPRFCAESIFPPLDFEQDRPTQNLSVTDVHGKTWVFRHIFRGTPKRHLLTTGWGIFVNAKKLVAGDSVVFMKNSMGKIFIGIRRAVRFIKGGDKPRWYFPTGKGRNRDAAEEGNCKEGFSRNGKGRLSVKSVVEAAELAAKNKPFEVVYYPKAGWSDFVVKAEAVEEALSVRWVPGLRVKMAVETNDSTRMTWFQGTVSSLSAPRNGRWQSSPWRMLQIAWDEAVALQNSKWVSPWQVELVSTTPALPAPFPPTKKFKAADGSGMSTDGGGDPVSMTELTYSTMRHLNQTLLSYDTFPAGMQGARHDMFSASNIVGDNPHLCISNSSGSNTVPTNPHLCIGNSSGSNTVPTLKTVSPDSQSSLPSCGTELVQNHSCDSTKPEPGLLRLLGVYIQPGQPVQSGSPGTDYIGSDSSKSCNEAEGIGNNPLDSSLTNSNLLGRHDDQCQ